MKKSAVLGLIFLGFLTSCQITEIDAKDPVTQRAEDIAQINDYIQRKNLGTPDTTESGARYFIMEVGEGQQIKSNDIVGLRYIASATSGHVYDTNISSVADTSTLRYDTLEMIFTYTTTGWTSRYLYFVSDLSGPGLGEAIAAGLSQVTTEGHIKVILPSDQINFSNAFGPLPAKSLAIYDIFPKTIY
ncbi:MAG: hypothetical protein JXQ90_20770 [Cyclobacteriaceae bacterium]